MCHLNFAGDFKVSLQQAYWLTDIFKSKHLSEK